MGLGLSSQSKGNRGRYLTASTWWRRVTCIHSWSRVFTVHCENWQRFKHLAVVVHRKKSDIILISSAQAETASVQCFLTFFSWAKRLLACDIAGFKGYCSLICYRPMQVGQKRQLPHPSAAPLWEFTGRIISCSHRLSRFWLQPETDEFV